MAAPNLMRTSSDFSTNRHAVKQQQEAEVPIRHPDICFNDGNVAILSESHFFLVHQGLLSRHSVVLKKMLESLEGQNCRLLEGRPVLQLPDFPKDMARFLQALYDGMCEDPILCPR